MHKMSNQDDTANQIEQFHELVALGRGGLQEHYAENAASAEWLAKFVSEQLLDTGLPPLDTAEAFANAVLELSKNKKSWSNRLSSLVIDLSDAQSEDDEELAVSNLKQFANQCPWKYLRTSALRKFGG
jgi:LPS sulfotransferase NodH